MFLPAGLTWLTQLLDVYVFAELRFKIREHLSAAKLAAPSGKLDLGAWVLPAARSIHEVLVHRDWSEQIARLGAGLDIESLRPGIQEYVSLEDVFPALQTLAEFVVLVNRRRDTESTRRIHQCMIAF